MTTVAVESSTFHVQEADHFPSLTTSDLLLQAAYRYPESGLRFVDDHGAGEVDCLRARLEIQG
ncbi:hypothetical protein G7939_21590 (plasmid) [Ralstonia solanacearum]|uniref:hypothetical protein n=1 Tax=Ralstonia pseudosolanacearum TaxID=1310165 RepID=UPI0012600839|nr:hypothetical protein [Ralstonia pseudosolanacearum]MCK4119398.1 hypothetical protein [Ralstonia pseudosolanacearum]QIK25997.1 hypothetical protein G7939_21590 [Ralstonia solanacearum]QIK30734.1 hypothetical protein G7947_20680 [Ralstonia solanacearum]QIK36297.1 hypothetical protein G7969_24525 [Ralstonia solanacearum]